MRLTSSDNPLLNQTAPQTETRRGLEILSTRSRRSTLDLVKKADIAAQLLRVPDPEETLHVLNDGYLEGVAIIAALVDLLDSPPVGIWISTLGANLRTVRNLSDRLQDGTLSSLSILGGVFFRDSDPETAHAVRNAVLAAGGKIAYARTHAKVWILESDRASLTCETSGNLRSCHCLEQVTITNSREVAAFHRRWIETTIARATEEERENPGPKKPRGGKKGRR